MTGVPGLTLYRLHSTPLSTSSPVPGTFYPFNSCKGKPALPYIERNVRGGRWWKSCPRPFPHPHLIATSTQEVNYETKMFRRESIEIFPNDHNLLKIPTSLRQFHIIKMALKWEFWAMRKCEYLRTPYTRLRRICPRHVSPVPVLCGERMAGKLADSPTTLCGNPILGHIEINGRAVEVSSAASHDVRYLSWGGFSRHQMGRLIRINMSGGQAADNEY